jgi:hypothetical protein
VSLRSLKRFRAKRPPKPETEPAVNYDRPPYAPGMLGWRCAWCGTANLAGVTAGPTPGLKLCCESCGREIRLEEP